MNEKAESEFKEGCTQNEKGDYPSALSHFKAAVKLDDSDPRYWISLGVCLMKLCHWREAVNSLKKGVELKPHYAEADARMFLAEALAAAGRIKEATKEWETVSGMVPTYPSYNAPIAEANEKLHEFRKGG